MRSVTLIFGKTGTGKSELAKKLLKQYNRKIVIDAMREYRDGIIFYNYKSFVHYIRNNYTKENDFYYILRLGSDEEFEKIFPVLFELENYVLLVEEAELYISPYSKKTGFNRIIRYGRHKNISIIGVARRASELSQDFKAQVNKIISFNQTNPDDLIKMRQLGFTGLENLKLYSSITIEY